MATEILITDLPPACVRDCSARGDVAVNRWLGQLRFTVPRDEAMTCLSGYGAWTGEELAAKTDAELASLIPWLACCSFNEWDDTEDSDAGSDVFVVE
jgi:hypothetical protein|tara:strand:- start:13395 stop:13685 length:291 start_codon:yes stop_codon:yes gene_type:complete